MTRRTVRHRFALLNRFLTPYLAMLVVPVLVALIIQSQTVAVVEQNTLSASQIVLDRTRDIIDRYLEEMVLAVQRLTLNRAISTFLSMDRVGPGDPDVYKLIEASEAISTYSVTNRFVVELFLYARASDTMLSTKTVHTNINLDYRPFFRFSEIEPSMWRSELLSRTYPALVFRPEVVTLYGVKLPCIAAFQSTPLNTRENSTGTVMALIDQGKIRELLSDIPGVGGTVYLTDASGNVLLAVSTGSPAIPLAVVDSGARARGEYVVSSAVSSSYGWRYVSILPRSTVMGRVDRIKRFVWVSTAAFIAAGLAVALVLAYRSSKPVSEIAALARSILGHDERSEEDIAYIRRSMIELVASNRRLEEARRKGLPLAQAAFLEKLVRGTVHGEEDVATLVRYNEIELRGDRYVVFAVAVQGFGDILRPDILQEMELNRIIIKDVFSRRIPDNGYAVDLALDRMALICSFDTADAGIGNLERSVLAVREELATEYGITIAVTRGRACATLLDVHESFGEAWTALQATRPAGAEAVPSSPEGAERDGFHYPVELESRIIHLTRAGHDGEVDQIMRDLYEDNFHRRCLSAPVLQTLIACLVGTLVRLSGDGWVGFSAADAARMEDGAESPQARFALVRQALRDLCAQVTARRRKNKEQLADRIAAFVADASSRPDLNLSMVATAFGLKESYLYHFFREAVGMTFAAHVESLRMDQARTLLRDSPLAVDEVAARVGYSSAHSFRRAFKRCTALSPSEYQRTHRGAGPERQGNDPPA